MNLNRFRINSYGNENWMNNYKVAELALSTGCPKEVSIPIYPDGSDKMNIRWYFTFEVENANISCNVKNKN